MPRRDSIDFATAFALGAVLGVGAVLLLRPQPRTRTERVLKDLEPYRRKMGQRAREARKSFGKGASATAEVGGLLRRAGDRALQDFRQEVAEVLAATRDRFDRAVAGGASDAARALRRGARRPRKS